MAYMCFAIKLRSTEIWSNVLQQFIGLQGTTRILAQNCAADTIVLLAFPRTKDSFEANTTRFVDEIHGCCMTYYRDHAHETSVGRRDDAVRTNFLDSSFRKSFKDRGRFLARSAFREWFGQQTSGEPHRSHVKYSTTPPKNGKVEVGSLRKTCELLIAAARNKYGVEVVGRNVAAKYAAIFDLSQQRCAKDGHPAVKIAHELRGILKEAKSAFHCAFSSYSNQTAHHDEGLEYFTSMSVDVEDFR